VNDGVRRVLALVPVLTAAVVLAAVPLPMFAVNPGPARDVVPLIEIQGHPIYEPSGHLLLTTVTVNHSTAFEALRGWLDEYSDVVPERLILPPGVTEEEEDRISRSQMDESKLTAAAVALARVTDYPQRHGSGALVRRVQDGSPAEGRLFPGDLIERVDGTAIGSVADVGRLVRAAGTRRRVSIVVRVEDQTRTVRLRPRALEADGAPKIGVELLESFPFHLLIESGDIGGPSAGLVWTIGVIDLLTPGDLTGGRRIAGTGTIDLDGVVGPIGGIGQKLVAAERAGADAFLVPRGDMEAAREADTDVELVPIDDLEDALDYLSSTCDCPGV
jgi:Lon-like protease